MKNELFLVFLFSIFLYLYFNNYSNEYFNKPKPQLRKKILLPPEIQITPNFLSIGECKDIISLCENSKDNLFKKSGTTNGHNSHISITRTSETISFKDGENELIDSVRDRVSDFFNINKQFMEYIQITKYSKGQEYKFHYDYFKNKVDNQRKSTILIYLNTLSIEDGGATKFYYGKSYQPKVGTMLKWSNTDKIGNKNKNTLHSGRPILSNVTKYILTIWTRHNILKE